MGINYLKSKYKGVIRLSKCIKLSVQCRMRNPVYGLYCGNEREKKIILSIATYQNRYKTIIPVLKSLLFQTEKADRIIVWLDEENDNNVITDDMEQMREYGIEYRYTTDSLKAHKKYYYSMREFPEDIVITVDDDFIYPNDLIESLLKMHRKYPDSVCARRVHYIRVNNEQKLLPYNEWYHEYEKIKYPSHMLCATGCGGILYPPHCLPEETFDMERIKEFCINADDIWLKTMELIGNIKVVWVKNDFMLPLLIKESQETTLGRMNIGKNFNDIYIQNMIKYFQVVWKN